MERKRVLQAFALGAAVATAACAQGVTGDPEGMPSIPSPDPPTFGSTDGVILGTPYPPGTVIQIDVGGAGSACALLADGDMYCWGVRIGENRVQSLGRTDHLQPVRVLSGVARMDVGWQHVCVLTFEQRVLCWGDNTTAQLGTGDTEPRATPTDVGLDHVVDVSTDGQHACAVRDDGSVFCWGVNSQLQSHTDYNWSFTPGNELVLRPMALPYVTNAIAIAAETPTCALIKDRTVMCWGRNIDPDFRDYRPRTVPGLDHVVELIAGQGGNTGSLARIDDGRVLQWDWDATKPDKPQELRLRSPGPVRQAVPFGYCTSIVVLETGQIDFKRSCKEQNPFGKKTDIILDESSYALLSDVRALASTVNTACAVTNENVIECAGMNDAGQLGDGTRTNRRTFAPVIWPNGKPPIIK